LSTCFAVVAELFYFVDAHPSTCVPESTWKASFWWKPNPFRERLSNRFSSFTIQDDWNPEKIEKDSAQIKNTGSPVGEPVQRDGSL
jgi:hypothetical protein